MPEIAQTAAAARAPLIVLNDRLLAQSKHMVAHCGVEDVVADYGSFSPVLVDACYRLGAYLPTTITMPYEPTPLFQRCLVAAGERLGGSDPVEDFFHGVLQFAPNVLRYNLVGKRGRWDPIRSAPLAVWLRDRGRWRRGESDQPPPWPPVPETRFANALFDRLVPAGQLHRPACLDGRELT